MSTPETDLFYEWANMYRRWLLAEFAIQCKEDQDEYRSEFATFMWTLPQSLRPLAVALEKNGFDSSVAWRAIGNPVAADIEKTLDLVWELAKRFEARQAPGDAPTESSALAISVESLIASARPKKKNAVEQAEDDLQRLLAARVIDRSWKLKELAQKIQRSEGTIANTPTWRSWMAKQ